MILKGIILNGWAFNIQASRCAGCFGGRPDPLSVPRLRPPARNPARNRAVLLRKKGPENRTPKQRTCTRLIGIDKKTTAGEPDFGLT